MKKTALFFTTLALSFFIISSAKTFAYEFYTTVTNPTNGSVVSGPVSFTAIATESAGISRVNFLVDNIVIATDYSYPYAVTWQTNSLLGGSTHTLQTVAYNLAGQSTSSPTVIVTKKIVDTTKPAVSITYPASNAQILINTPITIKATASDNLAVKEVRFFVDGVLKCTDKVAPYSCYWNGLTQKKTYFLRAHAVDTSNNGASSYLYINGK